MPNELKQVCYINEPIPGLSVRCCEDGVWLELKADTETSACINLSTMGKDSKGLIIGKAILDWCKQIALTPKKERPMGPHGEVGLDYADYLLTEIKKILDSRPLPPPPPRMIREGKHTPEPMDYEQLWKHLKTNLAICLPCETSKLVLDCMEKMEKYLLTDAEGEVKRE